MAEKPSRALSDDDRIWLGNPLQTSREIRRLSHDPAFLRVPRAHDVTDNDQPRRYADAHPEAQFADGPYQRQPRPDSSLGIVFVRLRITEIDEHPVAHVFGDEAIEPRDRLRDALVIG